jgi:hypothetical protein
MNYGVSTITPDWGDVYFFWFGGGFCVAVGCALRTINVDLRQASFMQSQNQRLVTRINRQQQPIGPAPQLHRH